MVALLLAIISAIVALFLPGADPITGVARFREVQTSYTRNGMREVWSTRVLLQHVDQAIGSGRFVCIYVQAATPWRACVGSYALPSGRVTVQGGIESRGRFVLVVTGGTGAYLGVRGELIVTRLSTRPTQDFLTFYFT